MQALPSTRAPHKFDVKGAEGVVKHNRLHPKWDCGSFWDNPTARIQIPQILK